MATVYTQRGKSTSTTKGTTGTAKSTSSMSTGTAASTAGTSAGSSAAGSAPVKVQTTVPDKTDKAVSTGAGSVPATGTAASTTDDYGQTDYSKLWAQGLASGADYDTMLGIYNDRLAKASSGGVYSPYYNDSVQQSMADWLALNKPQEQPQVPEPDVSGLGGNDYSDYIEQMNQAQQEAALAELRAAYERNLAGLDRTQQAISPQYETARNQAAGSAALQQQAFHEYAAANGLNSGAGGQAQLAMNNALQTNLSALEAAEASGMADLELQRSQAEIDYNNAIAQAKAQGNYELAQQLYAEKVRVDEALRDQILAQAQLDLQKYQLEYNAYRDGVSDQRYDQQWKYQLGRDQASDEQDAYEQEQNIAVSLAGAGQFGQLARLWGLSEAETQALVENYAGQKRATEAQAAQDLAAVYAQYGDFSKLRELGVNPQLAGTGTGGRSGSSGGTEPAGSGADYNGLFAAGSPAYGSVLTGAQNLTRGGYSGAEIARYLQGRVESGVITQTEAEAIAAQVLGG